MVTEYNLEMTPQQAMLKYNYTFEPFVKINQRNNFLLKKIPKLHPDGTEYLKYWKKNVAHCIEGFWGDDSVLGTTPAYRWMPPNLFFYVNLGTILHKPDGGAKRAARRKIRPHLRDVEWEFYYNWIECRGFSGFEDDKDITCNTKVRDFNLGKIGDRELYKEKAGAFKADGTPKEFMEAHIYLRKLHAEELGLALYDNEAMNFFMLGSRGFGKSYMVAVGVVLHEWLFDGRQYFYKQPDQYLDDEETSEAKVEVFVGAAQASKSGDLLSKMKDAYNSLPGGWGEGANFIPPPYYKIASGSLQPASQNPWKHEYQEKEAGIWQTKGSGSLIKHGVYTTENPEAAAGTRPSVMVVEEVGLLPNVLNVHNSNEACVVVGGIREGSCMYLGTGGNMEKIRESEIIFRDPKTYTFKQFDDVYELKGKIGWFVPAFYNLNTCKDENGNTLYDEAIDTYQKRRAEKRSGKSGQHAIDLELMNFPLTPSEMFLNKQGNILPIDELRRRVSELNTEGLYENIEKPVQLAFDSKEKYGVSYRILVDKSEKPINEFPTPQSVTSPEGCPVIYEFPILNDKGEIPEGMYIIGHDPIATDAETGQSYASIYVFKTGKYALDGYGFNEVVAEYVGRPFAGRNKVNEIMEKLAMLYNTGPGGIFFENDRGNTKEYFEKRKKLGLLAMKPTTVMSKRSHSKRGGSTVEYGYSISSKQAKMQAIEYLRDFLLEERGQYKGTKLINLDVMVPRALLQEMIRFNFDENFDRVMGFAGCVIGLRERENEFEEELTGPKRTAGSFFGNNKKVFNRALIKKHLR